MKINKILNLTLFHKIFFIFFAIICISCLKDEKKNVNLYDSSIPMWKEYYYESGMKYVILRDKHNGNIEIINITKDSLACEFLKNTKSKIFN